MQRISMTRRGLHEVGVSWVLGELEERGYLAAKVRSAAVDIVAVDPDTGKPASIKVRVRRDVDPSVWRMNADDERWDDPARYYCLVAVHDDGAVNASYVIPAGMVARHLRVSHRRWLDTPEAKGQPRRDNSVRHLMDLGGNVPGYPDGWVQHYRDGWHLLFNR